MIEHGNDETPDLFDGPKASLARDAAITTVGESRRDWVSVALVAIRDVAVRKEFFTTDDVLRGCPHLEGCPEKRMLGAAMRIAGKEGMISPTDRYTDSIRVSSHRRPKRVWKSALRRSGPVQDATQRRPDDRVDTGKQ